MDVRPVLLLQIDKLFLLLVMGEAVSLAHHVVDAVLFLPKIEDRVRIVHYVKTLWHILIRSVIMSSFTIVLKCD